MANEIMVALDGSEKGERALSVAIALAELADAAIHLVRVIEPPSQRTGNQAELIGLDAWNAAGRPAVERQLAETAAGLTTRSGRAISWEALDGADVSDTLTRVAEARKARAVVMGTRAATDAGLAIVGSVADRVMRECAQPVVLVPPGASDVTGRRLEIRRILLPLDGSALAAQAIDFVGALLRPTDLEFVLLEVVRNPRDVPFVGRPLALAADRLRERSALVRPQVMIGGNAAREITAAVREFLVDMIVMSTRGEGGLRRLVLGSVAEAVVRASDVPVLLLTPTMLAAQSRARAS